MKKIFLLVSLINWLAFNKSQAQTQPDEKSSQQMMARQIKDMKPKFGLKFGYNIAKLTGSSPDFSPQSKDGFNLSAFYAPSSKGLGYRTEIIFSRQGFSFDESGKTGHVTQDYIYMPHLTTFTIARRFQIQAGGQIGYLLNARKESSSQSTEEEKMMQYMNRFDYGAAIGFEIYPYKGFILGARYNISLGNPYKNSTASGSTVPVAFPLPVNPADFKGKNAVIQFAIGYRF